MYVASIWMGNFLKIATILFVIFTKRFEFFMALLPIRAQEISLPPAYWSVLTPEDKAEFMRLRTNFLQGQKISSKDRRIVTFRKELISVLKFIERSEVHQEERSVLVGVCFAGPVICVNTRQLKGFLGRCKSSINGSFQQMGYVALRTKAKARNCVVAVMPSLQNEQNILRQWTVRCASSDAQFCFLSCFSHVQLPTITEEDLYDEKKPTQNSLPLSSSSMGSSVTFQQLQAAAVAQRQYQQYQNLQIPQPPVQNAFVPMQANQSIPVKPRKIEFDLPSVDDIGQYEPEIHPRSDLASSMSLDSFAPYGTDVWDEPTGFETPSFEWDPSAPNVSTPKTMPHSSSAFLPSLKDYDYFDY